MKYQVEMMRRVSKNAGRNYCKYAVIVDTETGKIVDDDNLRYDRPEHLTKVQQRCDEMNLVGDYDKWFEIRMAKYSEMFKKMEKEK